MAWQDYANKYFNTPVVLISIAFNSGTRYYSNEVVRTSTQCYKGKVITFPQILASVGDIKRTYEQSKLTIVFNDADYEFRTLEDTETVSFKNRIVTISIAFSDDSYASPLTIFTGYIYDWKSLDNLQYEFIVAEKSKNIENEYPEKRVELTDYPYADGSAVGWVIPIPYGTISALGLSGDGGFGHPSLSSEGSGTGLLFVDTRTSPDLEKHLVGLQESGQAITVNRVYKNGILQTGGGTHYSISNATVDGYEHTTIDWASGVNPTAADFISCDITFGSRRPVEAIKHFLKTFCSYVDANFNTTSYNTATAKEVSRDYAFDGALWKREVLSKIMDNWRDELELDIYWNKTGEICFNYITGILPSSINHYIDLNDILIGFGSDPKVKYLLNYIKYGYNYHYSKTYYYNYNTYQNTDSQTRYGAIFKDFKGFNWIRSSAMANDITARKIVRFKDVITFDNFRFPLKTFSDNLTDTIKITHFEGKGAAGYCDKLFQIREVSYDIDIFVNSVLLEDASAFTGKTCVLGDGTVLPALWSDASGAERDYCYLCAGVTAGAEMAGQFLDGKPGKRLFD